jgi:hypothetical protein
MAIASKCKDSVSDLLFDVVALGCYIGPRLSKEYTQTTQDKVNHHTYPSGKNGHQDFHCQWLHLLRWEEAHRQKLEQWLPPTSPFCQDYLVCTKDPPEWPINYPHGRDWSIQNLPRAQRNATGTTDQMAESARWHVRHSFKTKKGKEIYLTDDKIAELLWKAVKEVWPDTTPDKLKQYSAHSLRVWACVLLDKSGKLPDYIKKRLRWLGDSFRMYQRDTAIIQHQHVDALLAALQEVMDLIAALPKDVIVLSTMTEEMDNPDMHKYVDEMD